MASKGHDNDPISHGPKGQGGRTFSSLKPGRKNKASSEHLKLRAKNQPVPLGADRYPHGKWYNWDEDPDNLCAKLGQHRPDKKKK